MKRNDLSDWVIHFIHDKNPANDPCINNIDFEYKPFPDSFNYKGLPLFLTNRYDEESYGLEPDASAFAVLKKILSDGYIKTGWSFRKGKPTVYGPKSAVCFTEMPLYALIEYAKERKNTGTVENYGIAFLKDELFRAGARPAIYGLSTKHTEAKDNIIGLRNLDPATGIGLKEQYRYVFTNMAANKKTDWTHEREWRWADINEEFDFPGMPFSLDIYNEDLFFSKIIVFVKTNDEKNQLISLLKNLYDSECSHADLQYNSVVIENIFVLSLDMLKKMNIDSNKVKLDDLPLERIPKIQKIIASPETKNNVSNALKKAEQISMDASKKAYDLLGKDVLPCGFAWVVTYVTDTEITQALLDLGIAHSFGDGSYRIHVETFPCQNIDVAEAGADAAAKFLTKELGQKFYSASRLD